MKRRMYHPIKPWHIAMMIGGTIAGGFSWKWSFDILSALFDVPTGIMLASMVILLEVYSLMQFILTWNPLWLICTIPGFILSVAGSYGNFQKNYEENVAKSDEYLRKEAEIKGYETEINTAITAAAEYSKNKQPWYAKRERERADKLREKKNDAETELTTMTDKGYGSSNALFRSISRHADMTTLDSAERSHLALGLVVELFMLLCTVIGTSAAKKGYAYVNRNEDDYSVTWDDDGNTIYTKAGKTYSPQKEKERQRIPIHGGNGIERPPSPTPPAPRQDLNLKLEDDEPPAKMEGVFVIPPGFHPSAKSKIDLTAAKKRKKEQRIRKLQEFLAQNPDATMTEKMKAIKVTSPNTVRNYEHEIAHRQ